MDQLEWQSRLSIKVQLKAEVARVISLYGQVVMAADTKIIATVMDTQTLFIQVNLKFQNWDLIQFGRLKDCVIEIGNAVSHLLLLNHLK